MVAQWPVIIRKHALYLKVELGTIVMGMQTDTIQKHVKGYNCKIRYGMHIGLRR